MRRRPRRGSVDLTERRRTIQYWPTKDPYRLGFYGHMFLEDIHIGIAPVGGRSYSGRNFGVELEPNTQEAEQAFATAVAPATEFGAGDIPAMFCDYLEQEAMTLVLYGRTAYEIVRHEGQAALVRIPPYGRLLKLPAHIVQVLPREIRVSGRRRFVILPRRDYWENSVPFAIESPLPAFRRRFVMARAGAVSPLWAAPTIGEGYPGGFDPEAFAYMSDVSVARATNSWSWPARGLLDKRTTYHEQVRRQLRHALVLAKLREYLTTRLNSLLRKAGVLVLVTVAGIPDSKELEEALRNLDEGKLRFTDALSLTRF